MVNVQDWNFSDDSAFCALHNKSAELVEIWENFKLLADKKLL